MSEILKFIGSAVVAIMLLAIPALFVLAITNGWGSHFVFIFAIMLIFDFVLLATKVNDMGYYDE